MAPCGGGPAETRSVSSLAKTICRGALFLGLLVASSHVDVAAAYWQSGGTSIGAAHAAAPLGVNQTADLGPVNPGAPAQTLSGTFDNRNGRAVHVATIRVSIAKVIKAHGAAAGTCDASDFTLTQRTIAVDSVVPAGRGTGSWSGGKVGFNNKPGVDQNACQGATVKLRYTTA
jgi:hypothetical protein